MCVFFNDTATTEIYTLSLHDALPISPLDNGPEGEHTDRGDSDHKAEPHEALDQRQETTELGLPLLQDLLVGDRLGAVVEQGDRKSTRLNSSHANISYAVFCLKKKRIP